MGPHFVGNIYSTAAVNGLTLTQAHEWPIRVSIWIFHSC